MATSFHVLGVGSLGLLFAHHLRNAGFPVTLVLRTAAAAESFRRAGSEVWLLPLWQKADGGQHAGADCQDSIIPNWESSQGFGAVSAAAEAVGRDDATAISALVVATKAPAAVPAIRTVLPRLAPGAHVVLLQNGVLAVADQLQHELRADLQAAGIRLYVASVTHGCYREADATGGASTAGADLSAQPREPHRLQPAAVHAPSRRAAPSSSHAPFSVVHAGNGQVLLGPLGPDVLSPAATSSTATTILTARPHAPPDGDGGTPVVSTSQAAHDGNEAAQFVRSLATSVPGLRIVPALDGAELRRKLLTKLATNCTINPLTAMLGCRNGAIVAQEHARDVVRDVCRELEAVFPERVAASGPPDAGVAQHVLDCTAGRVGADKAAGMPALAAPAGSTFESVLAVAQVTAHNLSSMLQDVRAGRPTEVEYLTGYVVRQAAKLGGAGPSKSDALPPGQGI